MQNAYKEVYRTSVKNVRSMLTEQDGESAASRALLAKGRPDVLIVQQRANRHRVQDSALAHMFEFSEDFDALIERMAETLDESGDAIQTRPLGDLKAHHADRPASRIQ